MQQERWMSTPSAGGAGGGGGAAGRSSAVSNPQFRAEASSLVNDQKSLMSNELREQTAALNAARREVANRDELIANLRQQVVDLTRVQAEAGNQRAQWEVFEQQVRLRDEELVSTIASLKKQLAAATAAQDQLRHQLSEGARRNQEREQTYIAGVADLESKLQVLQEEQQRVVLRKDATERELEATKQQLQESRAAAATFEEAQATHARGMEERLAQLQERVGALEDENRELRQQAQEYSSANKDLSSTLEMKLLELNLMEQSKATTTELLESAQKEAAELQEHNNQLRQQASLVPGLQTAAREKDELRRVLSQVQGELQAAESQVQQLASESKFQAEENARFQKLNAELEGHLQSLRDSYNQLTAPDGEFEAAKKNALDTRAELERQKAANQRLNLQTDGDAERILMLETKLDTLQNEIVIQLSRDQRVLDIANAGQDISISNEQDDGSFAESEAVRQVVERLRASMNAVLTQLSHLRETQERDQHRLQSLSDELDGEREATFQSATEVADLKKQLALTNGSQIQTQDRLQSEQANLQELSQRYVDLEAHVERRDQFLYQVGQGIMQVLETLQSADSMDDLQVEDGDNSDGKGELSGNDASSDDPSGRSSIQQLPQEDKFIIAREALTQLLSRAHKRVDFVLRLLQHHYAERNQMANSLAQSRIELQGMMVKASVATEAMNLQHAQAMEAQQEEMKQGLSFLQDQHNSTVATLQRAVLESKEKEAQIQELAQDQIAALRKQVADANQQNAEQASRIQEVESASVQRGEQFEAARADLAKWKEFAQRSSIALQLLYRAYQPLSVRARELSTQKAFLNKQLVRMGKLEREVFDLTLAMMGQLRDHSAEEKDDPQQRRHAEIVRWRRRCGRSAKPSLRVAALAVLAFNRLKRGGADPQFYGESVEIQSQFVFLAPSSSKTSSQGNGDDERQDAGGDADGQESKQPDIMIPLCDVSSPLASVQSLARLLYHLDTARSDQARLMASDLLSRLSLGFYPWRERVEKIASSNASKNAPSNDAAATASVTQNSRTAVATVRRVAFNLATRIRNYERDNTGMVQEVRRLQAELRDERAQLGKMESSLAESRLCSAQLQEKVSQLHSQLLKSVPADQHNDIQAQLAQAREAARAAEAEKQQVSSMLNNTKTLLAETAAEVQQRESTLSRLNIVSEHREQELSTVNEYMQRKAAQVMELESAVRQKQRQLDDALQQLSSSNARCSALRARLRAVEANLTQERSTSDQLRSSLVRQGGKVKTLETTAQLLYVNDQAKQAELENAGAAIATLAARQARLDAELQRSHAETELVHSRITGNGQFSRVESPGRSFFGGGLGAQLDDSALIEGELLDAAIARARQQAASLGFSSDVLRPSDLQSSVSAEDLGASRIQPNAHVPMPSPILPAPPSSGAPSQSPRKGKLRPGAATVTRRPFHTPARAAALDTSDATETVED